MSLELHDELKTAYRTPAWIWWTGGCRDPYNDPYEWEDEFFSYEMQEF